MLDFDIETFEKEEGLKISCESTQKNKVLTIILTGMILNRRCCREYFLDDDVLKEKWKFTDDGYLIDNDKNRSKIIEIKTKYGFRLMKYSSSNDEIHNINFTKKVKFDNPYQEEVNNIKSIFPTNEVTLIQSTGNFNIFKIALCTFLFDDDDEIPYIEGIDLQITDEDCYIIDNDQNWKCLRKIADDHNYDILEANTKNMDDHTVIDAISIAKQRN